MEDRHLVRDVLWFLGIGIVAVLIYWFNWVDDGPPGYMNNGNEPSGREHPLRDGFSGRPTVPQSSGKLRG